MPQSEKRIDRRIVRSRKAIIEAFERLLEQRDFEKITVSAIAREANIDRKTFYVHFGTIDGLLDAMAEDIVTTIVDEVQEALRGKDAVEAPERTVASFFSALNEVVCRNLVLNRRLVESSTTDMLIERTMKPFEKIIEERQLFPEELADDLFEYYMSFLLGGIISIYRRWILADDDVSVERVADVANKLTLQGLTSLEPMFC